MGNPIYVQGGMAVDRTPRGTRLPAGLALTPAQPTNITKHIVWLVSPWRVEEAGWSVHQANPRVLLSLAGPPLRQSTMIG